MKTMKAEREVDPTVKMSDVEALLAVVIEHHSREIGHLRYALSTLMHKTFGQAPYEDDGLQYAHTIMYPASLGGRPNNQSTPGLLARTHGTTPLFGCSSRRQHR